MVQVRPRYRKKEVCGSKKSSKHKWLKVKNDIRLLKGIMQKGQVYICENCGHHKFEISGEIDEYDKM